MAIIGHNSLDSEELRSVVLRIESLEDDKREVMADIKTIYAEAKRTGFDLKTLRKLIILRRVDSSERMCCARPLQPKTNSIRAGTPHRFVSPTTLRKTAP